MADREKLAEEWRVRGSHDWETATLARGAGAPTDTIAVLLQQTCEKYLKGYLISRGWILKKTHDVEELIDRAISYDDRFKGFLDTARLLTAYYMEDRYPPGPPTMPESGEIDSLFKSVNQIMKIVNEAIGGQKGEPPPCMNS